METLCCSVHTWVIVKVVLAIYYHLCKQLENNSSIDENEIKDFFYSTKIQKTPKNIASVFP
jgi:hypothetical protein